jgi:hypothetical protein
MSADRFGRRSRAGFENVCLSPLNVRFSLNERKIVAGYQRLEEFREGKLPRLPLILGACSSVIRSHGSFPHSAV